MDLYVVSQGSGPAVLFIHAGVADSRMWAHQMATPRHRSIAYDQRGFGKSPFVAEPYSNRGDAVAVLDHVGVDSAVIVGCSIGAGTAMELAIEDPERVNGLILVGAYPSGWVPEGGFEDNPLEAEAERAAESGDLDRVVEIDCSMWLVGYGRTEAEVDPAHRALFLEMDRRAVETSKDRDEHIQHRGFRLDDRLDEIGAPTLLVAGAHDEKAIIDASRYLADRLSDRRAVLIENAAHLPSLEQPEAFNAALEDFLGSI